MAVSVKTLVSVTDVSTSDTKLDSDVDNETSNEVVKSDEEAVTV